MVWGFLGAIAGGLLAGASSRRTNAANVAQSKWATRFNAREARMAEKRAWQRHMYERQYNDPAQQRARMEKAGFNPLLSINAGNVQSNVASQTGSAVFTPLQDNGAAIGNMIAGGFASLDSMKMQQQQIDLAKTEIEFQKQQLQDQSYKMSMTPRSRGLYGGSNVKQYRNARTDTDVTAYTAGAGTGEVNQGPLEGPTHLAYRGIRGGTELATGGGRIEALTPYYGDEPSEWIGYLNMANDIWHSGIKNEAYDPRWGYESHWPRPKQRPQNTKQYRKSSSVDHQRHMKRYYPTVYDQWGE